MKKQILFWLVVSILLTSCTSISKLFPKQPRPFQGKKFDSEQWKNGDYQTRGEMTRGKLIQQIYEIKKNQKEEILQLLGKPDEITEAICCYAGRNGSSKNKVELWLYFIETEKSERNANVANKEENPLAKQALKLYFDSGVNPNIGERDDDHSYFPMIGFLNCKEKNYGERNMLASKMSV